MRIVLPLLLAAALSNAQQPPPGPYPDGIKPVHQGKGVWRFDRPPGPEPAFWQRLAAQFNLIKLKDLPFGRSVAFVSGVSDYKILDSLKHTSTDVTQMRNFLLTLGGFDTVFEMRDSAVNANELNQYMRNRFSKSDSRYLTDRDRFLFYYSGHGGNQGDVGYLLFANADPKDGDFVTDALDMNTVRSWATVNVARQVLFILDACNSGLAIQSQGNPLSELGADPSGILLTATTGNAEAYQLGSEGKGYGVFTHAILNALEEGLNQKTPFIDIYEVYGRARAEVSRILDTVDKKMTPNIEHPLKRNRYDKVTGTFVFVNNNPNAQAAKYNGTHKDIKVQSMGPESETAPGRSDELLRVARDQYELLKNSNSIPALRAYVKDYQNVAGTGAWVVSIQERIDTLSTAPSTLVPPPSSPVTPLGPQAGQTKTGTDGLTYVWISPDDFIMGCSPSDDECFDNEKPAHKVAISKGFWMGKTEVTQAAYQKVMKANPSHFKGPDNPVEQVDWNQAKAYCEAAGMRLPTEAEWEYAARAGKTQSRYGELDSIAWYNKNSQGKTHPVGSKKHPNAWGLDDMLGNVWEWTNDWYGEKYYDQRVLKDPQGPTSGTLKVRRGGSWGSYPRSVRVSGRFGSVPGGRFDIVGLRCVGE